MTNERVQPCDRMSIPVFLTYASDKGLRADEDMFAESAVICLRWYDAGGQMHQRIAVRPEKWYDGKNYFDPDGRKWKYE